MIFERSPIQVILIQHYMHTRLIVFIHEAMCVYVYAYVYDFSWVAAKVVLTIWIKVQPNIVHIQDIEWLECWQHMQIITRGRPQVESVLQPSKGVYYDELNLQHDQDEQSHNDTAIYCSPHIMCIHFFVHELLLGCNMHSK